MANKLKGEVGFKVDNVEHVIRFSADAMVVLEGAFDMPIKAFSSMIADESKFSFSILKRMFAIGLRDARPDADDEEVTRLFRSLAAKEASEIVTEAYNLAWGVDAEAIAAAEQNPQKPSSASNGAGSASSTGGSTSA